MAEMDDPYWYYKGFNSGYWLARHDENGTELLFKGMDMNDIFSKGMVDGKKQWQWEKVKEQQKLRSQPKKLIVKSNEKERNR